MWKPNLKIQYKTTSITTNLNKILQTYVIVIIIDLA